MNKKLNDEKKVTKSNISQKKESDKLAWWFYITAYNSGDQTMSY